jgi:hypothetical protein
VTSGGSDSPTEEKVPIDVIDQSLAGRLRAEQSGLAPGPIRGDGDACNGRRATIEVALFPIGRRVRRLHEENVSRNPTGRLRHDLREFPKARA